jgi:hypothetical protein
LNRANDGETIDLEGTFVFLDNPNCLPGEKKIETRWHRMINPQPYDEKYVALSWFDGWVKDVFPHFDGGDP